MLTLPPQHTMKTACFIVAVTGSVVALDLDDPALAVADRWAAWKQRYAFHGAEEAAAFDHFAANDAIIAASNARARDSRLSYTLGHNAFSDLSLREFKRLYLAAPMPAAWRRRKQARVDWSLAANATAPAATGDAVDWTAKGAVTAVKNQGQCGSCWAFSTTGAMEGAFQIAGNALTSFSEQTLVSCATSSGNQGCNGGLMDKGFEWIETNGIASESAYPYTSGGGVTGACKPQWTPVAKVGSYADVPAGDEAALQAAIAKGPVSVAIEADKSAFQLYKGGVLSDAAGCGTQLDHGVLAVGYGTDGGVDYYKVKNSWGAAWGEAGYVRMERGVNICGIALSASQPTGAVPTGPTPAPTPPTPAPAPTPPTPPTPVPNPWPYVLNSEFRDANCAEPLGPSPSVTPTDVCAPGKDGTSWRKSACSPTGTLYYQYTYDNADCSGTPVTFTGNTGECYQNQAYTFSEFKCSATNSTAAAASV